MTSLDWLMAPDGKGPWPSDDVLADALLEHLDRVNPLVAADVRLGDPLARIEKRGTFDADRPEFWLVTSSGEVNLGTSRFTGITYPRLDRVMIMLNIGGRHDVWLRAMAGVR